MENTVGAEPYPVFFFIRLKMNIRCPLVDGIEQYLVYKPDDRRVIDLGLCDIGTAALIFTAGNIDVIEIGILQGVHGGGLIIHQLLDDGAEFVFFNEDRLGIGADIEFDLIQCLQIGRVGYSDKQAVTALEQGQGAVFLDQFLVHQLGGGNLQIHGIDIEQGDTEFLGGGAGDGCAVEHLVVDKISDQRHLFLDGLFIGIRGLVCI